jgi:hypothetical protein
MEWFTWRRHGLWLVVGAIVLWGGWQDRARREALSATTRALDSAVAASQTWETTTAIAEDAAAEWERLAAKTARDANLAAARATMAEQRLQRERAAFEAARRAAPDTCAGVIAAADSALAAADSTIGHWQDAAALERRSRLTLQFALDTTRIALDGAKTVITDLRTRALDMADVATVPWYKRLIPKPGIGLATGFDAELRPRTIVGVTLGWTR